MGGTLYGEATFGGSFGPGCGGLGCGTVYSITTSGTESVLYRFAGGSDGELPGADLTNVGGTQQQVIQIEYAVRRDISIVALRDDTGTFGIDVIFRKYFK